MYLNNKCALKKFISLINTYDIIVKYYIYILIKTHENVENFLQNDIRSKNKHFEIVLLKKLNIYILICKMI